MIEQTINERLTDNFFRRYSSRVFAVWFAVCVIFYNVQLAILCFLPAEKITALIPILISGKYVCLLSAGFIIMNFIKNSIDSTKLDSLAKIIEAAKS